MREKKLKAIHPGEILREEFLKPLGISQYRLAQDISVPLPRINEIVNERRAISADTALRLSRFFGISEQFWLGLQSQYDLDIEKDKLGGRLLTDVIVHRGTPGVDRVEPRLSHARSSDNSGSRAGKAAARKAR